MVAIGEKWREETWFCCNVQSRSGLFNLFRDHEMLTSEEWNKSMSKLFKGSQRKRAREEGEGVSSFKTGIDPMSYQLLTFLSEVLI